MMMSESHWFLRHVVLVKVVCFRASISVLPRILESAPTGSNLVSRPQYMNTSGAKMLQNGNFVKQSFIWVF